MGKDVIIALDFPSGEEALSFLDGLGGAKPFVKVGMELYYATGGAIVDILKRRGHKVFLDLKLHDIPNTVKSAMRVLAKKGVDIINLHAAGTIAMMQAALKGLNEGAGGTPPLLFAVTQLTSTSNEDMNDELLIPGDINDVVVAYAKNAQTAGLNGVVCSPLEALLVKKACGDNFETITPGIRFADSASDDQSRITTPAKAKQQGSDYIVVGRPITRADNPLEAYKRCVDEFVG